LNKKSPSIGLFYWLDKTDPLLTYIDFSSTSNISNPPYLSTKSKNFIVQHIDHKMIFSTTN